MSAWEERKAAQRQHLFQAGRPGSGGWAAVPSEKAEVWLGKQRHAPLPRTLPGQRERGKGGLATNWLTRKVLDHAANPSLTGVDFSQVAGGGPR